MAREFPIANGKLVTDLDANGHKILNAQGGGSGGGTTDYNALRNKPKINDIEVSGSKSAEDYGLATKEQLNAVKETAENKRDKADNTAAADSEVFTEWKFHCEVPEIQAALDANPPGFQYDGGGVWDALIHTPLKAGDWWVTEILPCEGGEDTVALSFPITGYHDVNSDTLSSAVTATREKTVVTKSGEPYVTPTGVGAIVQKLLPYSLVAATIADGTVALQDRAVNAIRLGSDVPECTFVFPGRVGGKARDFMLRLELVGEEMPTLSFVEPDGGHVNFDYTDEDWAAVEQGVNVFMFSDTKEGE